MATQTSSYGSGRREGHDASEYYARQIGKIEQTKRSTRNIASLVDRVFVQSAEHMTQLPDDSVALMVTSPPYHVGKDYDGTESFEEYLNLVYVVMAETFRVLEPGGRAVVNVANLGRRPYVPLSHLVTSIMHDIGSSCELRLFGERALVRMGVAPGAVGRPPRTP